MHSFGYYSYDEVKKNTSVLVELSYHSI